MNQSRKVDKTFCHLERLIILQNYYLILYRPSDSTAELAAMVDNNNGTHRNINTIYKLYIYSQFPTLSFIDLHKHVCLKIAANDEGATNTNCRFK